VTGKTIDRKAGARRPGDPPSLIASNAKAERVLGWRATRSDLATVIREENAWAWQKRLMACARRAMIWTRRDPTRCPCLMPTRCSRRRKSFVQPELYGVLEAGAPHSIGHEHGGPALEGMRSLEPGDFHGPLGEIGFKQFGLVSDKLLKAAAGREADRDPCAFRQGGRPMPCRWRAS